MLKTLGVSTKGMYTHLWTKYGTNVLKEISYLKEIVLPLASQEHKKYMLPSKKCEI